MKAPLTREQMIDERNELTSHLLCLHKVVGMFLARDMELQKAGFHKEVDEARKVYERIS